MATKKILIKRYNGASWDILEPLISAGNVPNLDAGQFTSGVFDSAVIPAIAKTTRFVVATQVAQEGLSAQEGDICIRTDEHESYMHNGGSAGTMADWTLLLTPDDNAVFEEVDLIGAVDIADIKEDIGTDNGTKAALVPINGGSGFLKFDNTWETPPDTWLPNTDSQDGYVEAGDFDYDKVWKTDALGVPGWRDDINTQLSFGPLSTETVEGNDIRLSDDRVPLAHDLETHTFYRFNSIMVSVVDAMSRADLGADHTILQSLGDATLPKVDFLNAEYIAESTTKKLITDTERTDWNAKGKVTYIEDADPSSPSVGDIAWRYDTP